jgi:hypothetical protein
MYINVLLDKLHNRFNLTTNGIRAMVTFLGRVSGHVGFEVVFLFVTLDVRHSWNVERLTSNEGFGQCEETHK